MKWSWKLARIAGIDIYIHATFLLLLLWLGISAWLQEGTLTAVIANIGFVLALFACVVAHEYGHALTARHFGIATRHITLLPIGGVAALERMPRRPAHEFLVALAGPAVNLVIAIVLWLMPGGAIPAGEGGAVTLMGGSFLQRLMMINLVLALFNLLPAFPMDGGRVLRAALAMRMEYASATRMAASIGQALAFGMGFIGLFTNPFLLFIALFIWIGAAAEANETEVRNVLSGIPVRRAMLTDYATLAPTDTLARAIDLTMAGTQKDFPVMKGGRLVGVLKQADMLRGLREQGERAQVDKVMQTDIPSADIDEPLEDVLERLRHHHCRLIPVMDNGRVAGLVDLDNITELLQIHAALHGQ